MFQYYYFFQSEGRQNPLIPFNTVNIAINCYTVFTRQISRFVCYTRKKIFVVQDGWNLSQKLYNLGNFLQDRCKKIRLLCKSSKSMQQKELSFSSLTFKLLLFQQNITQARTCLTYKEFHSSSESLLLIQCVNK